MEINSEVEDPETAEERMRREDENWKIIMGRYNIIFGQCVNMRWNGIDVEDLFQEVVAAFATRNKVPAMAEGAALQHSTYITTLIREKLTVLSKRDDIAKIQSHQTKQRIKDETEASICKKARELATNCDDIKNLLQSFEAGGTEGEAAIKANITAAGLTMRLRKVGVEINGPVQVLPGLAGWRYQPLMRRTQPERRLPPPVQTVPQTLRLF